MCDMENCDGCKWWSELVVEGRAVGQLRAMCLNIDSPSYLKMVDVKCHHYEPGTAVDCPVTSGQSED